MSTPARAAAPAVVVGLDCITGLQSARILAERGIPVVGIAADRRHFCARTRVCSSVVESPTAGEGLVATLERLTGRLGTAVLLPCTDGAVQTISEARERLEPGYRFVLPDHDVVETLMDKVSFTSFAQRERLPIPAAVVVRTGEDAELAAGSLRFPVVLKPALKGDAWFAHTKTKAFRLASPGELLDLYERCSTWSDGLLVQEWIEGGEDALYSCNCYFDRNSEPQAVFIARKIRQWPPQTGTSCLGEEVRNDAVREESLALLSAVRYRGLAYVEMKRDAASGRYFIVEPNVGRPTGRSAIAEKGGVELLMTAYRDALGEPLPAAREQRYTGVKWIYWRHDLQSAVHYWRRGELSLGAWWRSIQGPKAEAVFSWRDPAPGLADVGRAVGVALGRGIRGSG
jgi:predicted ATP-grasp superfamily ATP-dependent carboligase